MAQRSKKIGTRDRIRTCMPLLQGGAISGRCGYQKLHHAGKYWCRWRDSNPQNSLSENEMSTMKLHHIGISGTPDRTRTCIFHPLPYLLVRSEGGYWGKNWIFFFFPIRFLLLNRSIIYVGWGSRSRTWNLLYQKQLLYQLS